MTQILVALNTAAMVLGYVSFALILIVFGYFFMWFVANYRYKQKRKRRQDQEWDDVRSKWLYENPVERPYPATDTDVLPSTLEQFYDYEKEQYRDAS